MTPVYQFFNYLIFYLQIFIYTPIYYRERENHLFCRDHLRKITNRSKRINIVTITRSSYTHDKKKTILLPGEYIEASTTYVHLYDKEYRISPR